MINKNHASDIRVCQRIKFDQALYILTMYQKKIRKNRQPKLQTVIQADEELEDITYAWKNKWKMDLTKPVLNCVTSVHPRILIDLGYFLDQRINNYYQVMSKFVNRLRMEHEDETNFKFILLNYNRTTLTQNPDKFINCAKNSVLSILNAAYLLSSNYVKTIQDNFQLVINQQISNVQLQSVQWQALRPLRFIKQICLRAGAQVDQVMQSQQTLFTPQSQQASQLVTFVSNTTKIMQRIKESEHGSTLITIQPRINELTYVIHPLLACIYSNFKKQNLQKQKDFNWTNIPVDRLPTMQNAKGSYNLSKIVFINFDGYESEFNLQFARNFKKNLMYISFPKQDATLDDTHKIYSKRFHKKLMFKYSQANYMSYVNENYSQDLKNMMKIQELNYNPQNYHVHTQKLYSNKNQKTPEDINNNVYVFPIRNSIMKETFPEIFQSSQDIESNQSYFIRFIMRDFLVNQIREFNPSYIMISYSGRITIQDSHFVQILQQLTKVANYKLLFFPNLTTAFCQDQLLQTQDSEGNQCDYDGIIHDKKIKQFANMEVKSTLIQEEKMEQEQTDIKAQYGVLQFFNKIARFLKVSSGTYNLSKSYDEESLSSKFKNQFILTYTDQLMTALGKDYNSIDRIRFKNKDLSIIPKLFQENLKSIKKSFERTVPKFYFQLYKAIQYMLFSSNSQNDEIINFLKSYQINPDLYKSDLLDLEQELTKKSHYQINSFVGNNNISQQILKAKTIKNKQKLQSLKESHFLQISSQKYEQKINVYVKLLEQQKQYNNIQEQTQQINGLFQVSFFQPQTKAIIKIFETTKILYRVDQKNKKQESTKVPILVMNNLCDYEQQFQKQSFQNYYAELDISGTGSQRKNIEERRCIAYSINFQDQNGNVENSKKFTIKSEWNYHQTQNLLILFWPTQFDFIKATIYKLINKNYSPNILPQIYIASKTDKTPIFKKVLPLSEALIAPRTGCSCYEFEQKLFIFGGFYQRQKNYLELQHDISVFDIRSYILSENQKIVVQNLKRNLYGQTAFEDCIKNQQKSNSFIRPRMEMQVFDKDQLMENPDQQQDPKIKKIILFGGYGQNFIRPYSLLTYFYYEIHLSKQYRTIVSVQKKFIYNKTVPINTKQMTKNINIIRTNKKNRNGVLQSKKISEPDSYALFRNSFKIQKTQNGQEFKYKYKFMFSEDEYRSFKQQIKKIQQQRTQEFDSSTISVQKMEGNNHLLILQKDGKRCAVNLYLQIPHEKAKRLGCNRQVKLTHQSIVYLDIWNSIICAIIKHDLYTKGKSVLVQYNIKSLQNLSFNEDEIPHIALVWLKQFDIDLSLHILIACNKNTIAILHGQKLIQSESTKEFIIKKKKTKPQVVAYQIKNRQHPQKIKENPFCGCSIFFRQRNKIISTDYLSYPSSTNIVALSYEIELNTSNDQYKWVPYNQNNQPPRYKFQIKEGVSISLQKFQILDYLKTQTERIILIQFNKKNYIVQLDRQYMCQDGVRMLMMVEQGKMKVQRQNVQRGIILSKTIESYIEAQN